jgi:putative peptidoglycan lipid II flippase
LRKEGVYLPHDGWGRLLLQVALASVAMALVTGWGAGDLASWAQAGVATRVLRLALLVALGVVVYIVVLLVLGVRPRELILRTTET